MFIIHSHFDDIYWHEIIIKSGKQDGHGEFTVKSFIATWLKVNLKTACLLKTNDSSSSKKNNNRPPLKVLGDDKSV